MLRADNSCRSMRDGSVSPCVQELPPHYPILLSGRIPSGDAPAIGKSFAEGTAADLRSSSAIIGSVANASHKPLKSVGHGCLIFRGLARNDN